MYTETLTAVDFAKLGVSFADLSHGGTVNKVRGSRPLGTVVHTPSVTFANKALSKFKTAYGRTPTAAELDDYAAQLFDVVKYQPNYMIGTTGKLFCLDADCYRTSHAGGLAMDSPVGDVYSNNTWRDWASPSDGSGWRRHGRPGNVVYDYWNAAWPGAKSPLDVYPWGKYPNEAVGIDLLPNPANGHYVPEQLETFKKLVRALGQLHNFPLDLRHNATHTLAAPVERGTQVVHGKIIGVHWDPDRRVWPHADVIEEL